MTTQLTTTKRICEHLEKYVFDRVWNEPYTQYRSYIKPELLSKNAVGKTDENKTIYRPYFAAGFFPNRYGSDLLPPYVSDAELLDWLPKQGLTFAVYSVPASFFGSIKLNIPDWTLFSTYCTKNHLDLQMFTSAGVCLNRGYICIRQSTQRDGVLIAVESQMYRKLVGDIASYDEATKTFVHADDMYFGKYFDSDSKADNIVGFDKLTSSQVPRAKSMGLVGQIELQSRDGSKVKLKDATYVLRNGRLCVGDYSSHIVAKDYIEAVVDEDIRGYFDVELNDSLVYTDEQTESADIEGTETKRLLIHIPKHLNPKYNLITPDTCGLWAYDSSGNNVTGVYLYSCGRGNQFHQITHSDFSIDVDLLESIKEEKGWSNITVRVYVRTHNDLSLFIRDGHYIDYLYNLEDDEIIQMLLGKHSWQTEKNKLLFWKADFLEDSKYSDALLRRRSRELDVKEVYPPDTAWDGPQCCKRDIYNYSEDNTHPQCEVCGIQNLCPNKVIEPNRTSVCPYYSSRSIQDYIDILGYFHVLALVGKRVFHYKILDNGTQYVIVNVPLALSYPELGSEDYYPIVYLNGERVAQVDVSWNETCATNVGAKELSHSDTTEIQVADVIPANYSTRLKVAINKVYRETKHRAFTNYTKYYKLYNGDYVRALVVEGNPVELVKTATDETGKTIRVGLPFEKGKVYFSRINKEYRKLVEGTDYKVGDDMYEFTQAHQGYLIFTGLDELDPNELAYVDGVVGDCVRLDDDTVIYELFNEVKAGDTISVELLDRRTDNTFEMLDMTGKTTVSHQFKTLDYWQIYQVDKVADIDGTMRDQYTLRDPEYLGEFDPETKVFTFFPEVVNAKGTFFLIEGPNVEENSMEFTIERGDFRDDPDRPGYPIYNPGTTGIIGPELLKSQVAFPLDSDIVFLNNKRLIPDLDYVVSGERSGGNVKSMTVFSQNVSYLQEVNDFRTIRTSTTVIPASVQRGFVIGHHISWKGQTPIWFDELSTLTVDGKLIANYKQILGEITLSPVKCRNGATYEIKTSISTLVKDILNYDEAMEIDLNRIAQIHEFFIEAFDLPDMTAIIPHSHRLYSIFLEAIISKYLTDNSFEINRLASYGGNVANYKQQFLSNPYFKALYDLDVVFDSERISPYFLNFIDVYGIYHPIVAKYREDYDTLHELCDVFLPEDNIKHKEAKK